MDGRYLIYCINGFQLIGILATTESEMRKGKHHTQHHNTHNNKNPGTKKAHLRNTASGSHHHRAITHTNRGHYH